MSMSESDDPACGSVSAMVPKKRPESRCFRYRSFCSEEANAGSNAALPTVSETYAVVLTLAAAKIAWQAPRTVVGSCIPPLSKSSPAARKPAAMYASSASFTSGMRCTRPPWKVGSWSSAFRLCGANFSSAIASAVSTAASIVSRECCAKRGRFSSDSTSSTSKSWNSRSRRLTIREPMLPPSDHAAGADHRARDAAIATRSFRPGSVEQRLHLEREVVGAALLRAGRIVPVDPLVLEGEVHEVEGRHVVLQAERDPRLAGGHPCRGSLSKREGIVVADLPLLELAEDGGLYSVIVVPRLREVVGLLEDGGVGPRVRGRAGRAQPEAAVVVPELQQADDLVTALATWRAAQRIVEEDGAADAEVRVLVGPGGWRGILAELLVVEVAHHAEDPLGAEVMTAVDVPRFRVPKIGRHHRDETGRVVAGGLGGNAGLSAALEDAHAVFDVILYEEAVGLEAEVAEDVAVALQDRRGVDVGVVDAHVGGRRLQAVAGQRHQDAAAAQPEEVGELDLAIGVEDLGRHERLGAGLREIGPSEVRSLEQDVEVDVLEHRSGREEAAAAAVEVHGI